VAPGSSQDVTVPESQDLAGPRSPRRALWPPGAPGPCRSPEPQDGVVAPPGAPGPAVCALNPSAHQGVVEADVSLQPALPVLKLDDRHFSGGDGQDVPQPWGRAAGRVNTQHAKICRYRFIYSNQMRPKELTY